MTGASSGIGQACAERLARRGFHVFPGVRREADGKRLGALAPGNITPVILDVTEAASIRSAVGEISRDPAGSTLCGLVNNAGISIGGPLEMLPVESFRKQIEVNLIGQLAVTQAFLPLLRAGSGRIIIMGSILGKFALPFLGAYSCAKYALEAMADSLGMELKGSGVSVSILEPGNISTPIWDKSKGSALDIAGDLSEKKWDFYRDGAHAFIAYAERTASGGIPPARVARVVEKALTARAPRKRYTVGWDSRFLGRVLPMFPPILRQAILRGAVLPK